MFDATTHFISQDWIVKSSDKKVSEADALLDTFSKFYAEDFDREKRKDPKLPRDETFKA